MSKLFPSKMYGRCPIGHNSAPSGDTGDNLSTTEISAGEERPLYWSAYYQEYVCKYHILKVADEKHEKRFHDRDQRIQRKLSAMGITKS